MKLCQKVCFSRLLSGGGYDAATTSSSSNGGVRLNKSAAAAGLGSAGAAASMSLHHHHAHAHAHPHHSLAHHPHHPAGAAMAHQSLVRRSSPNSSSQYSSQQHWRVKKADGGGAFGGRCRASWRFAAILAILFSVVLLSALVYMAGEFL